MVGSCRTVGRASPVSFHCCIDVSFVAAGCAFFPVVTPLDEPCAGGTCCLLQVAGLLGLAEVLSFAGGHFQSFEPCCDLRTLAHL